MVTAGYTLQHFYYGQTANTGKPDDELQLIAASSGLSQDRIAEMVRLALLPPLTGAKHGAWALVRGKAVPFVLVHSRVTDSKAVLMHFIDTPVEVLRSLGGNLTVIDGLFAAPAPESIYRNKVVAPIMLTHNGAPAAEEQTESILNLMTYSKNRINTIEKLLAALIQSVPVYVLNSPSDVTRRVGFVEGLLALLPPPVRFGVTFTAHSLPSTRMEAQIRFHASDDVPADALTYNWSNGELTGKTVDDDYARFIVSQLRLDIDQVLHQTTSLTPVASWRIKRGDTLSEAMSYAAYRLRVDDAVENNLPVDADEVARVLAEDPTLPEPLKAQYVRHVLAFALALNDMSHAESLAVMLASQPRLSETVIQQMTDALDDGRSALVYDTLKRWLNDPLGPSGMEWAQLLQRSAQMYHESLLRSGDIEKIHDFLDDLHSLSFTLQMSEIVPRVIQTSLPLMNSNPDIGRKLFRLSAEYLPGEDLLRLLSQPHLLSEMPDSMIRLTPYLTDQNPARPAPGMLVKVAQEFGERLYPLMIARLCEVALLAERYDLVDVAALSALARVATREDAHTYEHVFRWVVQNLSTEERLPEMEDPGPRSLLQILLARRAYPDLTQELIRHQRVIYPDSKQPDYALMVRRLFSETPIALEEVPHALQALVDSNVKPLPLVMASLGVLKRHGWTTALDTVAANVTRLLVENPLIVDAIPAASLVELLRFHVDQQETRDAIRIARLLPIMAARKGEGGAALMSQMYTLMDWSDETRKEALEVLRRYIRVADELFVQQAVQRLGEGLGERIHQALIATYALRKMRGDLDLGEYAEMLHLTAEFLSDTTMPYIDRRRAPDVRGLISDLNSLGGGLNDNERRDLARTMILLGRAVLLVGGQGGSTRILDPTRHINQLLAAEIEPETSLDYLYVMGGYFSRGRRIEMEWKAPTAPHPLGSRAGHMLLREIKITNSVLRSIHRTVPTDDKLPKPTKAAVEGEIDSLWNELDLAERRKLLRQLSTDFQRVAELVARIVQLSDARVMDDDNNLARRLHANRARPASTLELYRFVSGYFRSRVRSE